MTLDEWPRVLGFHSKGLAPEWLTFACFQLWLTLATLVCPDLAAAVTIGPVSQRKPGFEASK